MLRAAHEKTILFIIRNFIVFTNMKNLLSTASPIYLDAPSAWGLYFQDSATPQMEGLIELHDNILYFLLMILCSVG